MVYIPTCLFENIDTFNFELNSLKLDYTNDKEIIKILNYHPNLIELNIDKFPLHNDTNIQFRSVKILQLQIGNLECLKLFPNLNVLRIGYTRDYELNNLVYVPNLSEFCCRGGLTDTSLFNSCPNLVSIDIGESQITNLNLNQCKNLVRISNQRGQYQNFEGLSCCSKLKIIYCNYGRITSLQGLENLKLNILDVSECRELTNIDAIKNNISSLLAFFYTKTHFSTSNGMYDGLEHFCEDMIDE